METPFATVTHDIVQPDFHLPSDFQTPGLISFAVSITSDFFSELEFLECRLLTGKQRLKRTEGLINLAGSSRQGRIRFKEDLC